MTYDIVIIGGGPAGLSAAITARARNKNTLVISNPLEENPLASSLLVENYPGMPSVGGIELLETMHRQAADLGTQFLEARAISIVPLSNSFSVTTSNEVIEGRSIIIAVGASSGGKLFSGETEFLGRGVSYCATCDGMLFRNATVLIVGLNA
ncbi:MAG: FAD-dependent oxidoreductase, partial [Coriobacteriales bacterium]|nr:FAD-dependent oxidoreductase [Coriobacteriales bacterium]